MQLPSRHRIALATLWLAIIAGSSLPAGVAVAVEEPRYQTLLQQGGCSLRVYAPMIVAETLVEGTMGQASNAGFRRIAGYIFGHNHARSGGGTEKIAMTAPVVIEPESQQIPMTAPVTLEPSAGRWRLQFVMPSSYTLATLPVPEDGAVHLREIPEQRYAVISFSGLVDAGKMRSKSALLQQWMNQHSLIATGTPQLARYNPPWTLPFLRRNEILIPCR
jgi:hypothetical protein